MTKNKQIKDLDKSLDKIYLDNQGNPDVWGDALTIVINTIKLTCLTIDDKIDDNSLNDIIDEVFNSLGISRNDK